MTIGPKSRRLVVAVAVGILATLAVTLPAMARQFGAWGLPHRIDDVDGNSAQLNTPYLDGCPIISPNGLDLFLASNRPGGLGGIDIYVAHRSSQNAPFGAPINPGAPINSAADDFCPTPVRGNGLFFVSTRDGGCGGADVYFARNNRAHGWSSPANLGCGVNSAGPEFGPSYFEADGRAWLYFSSGADIFASLELTGGGFAPAAPIAELNTATTEFRPNVRKTGLEIVFDSDRGGGSGGQDLWFATRRSVDDPWSAPTNAGPLINTTATESRGSFSWDGTTLYFGRAPGPEGGSDIYVATR